MIWMPVKARRVFKQISPAPMMTTGVNVDLPKTDATPVNSDNKPITVSIKADGSTYIGDQVVSLDELVAKLQAMSQNDPTHRIFVRGDQHIDYGKVMEVMGMIFRRPPIFLMSLVNTAWITLPAPRKRRERPRSRE